MQVVQTPLRDIRKHRGLTLQDVATAINLDVGNLSRIERGMQIPSLEVAERLSIFFEGQISEMQILYPHRYLKTNGVA